MNRVHRERPAWDTETHLYNNHCESLQEDDVVDVALCHNASDFVLSIQANIT